MGRYAPISSLLPRRLALPAGNHTLNRGTATSPRRPSRPRRQLRRNRVDRRRCCNRSTVSAIDSESKCSRQVCRPNFASESGRMTTVLLEWTLQNGRDFGTESQHTIPEPVSASGGHAPASHLRYASVTFLQPTRRLCPARSNRSASQVGYTRPRLPVSSRHHAQLEPLLHIGARRRLIHSGIPTRCPLGRHIVLPQPFSSNQADELPDVWQLRTASSPVPNIDKRLMIQ